MIFFLDKFRTNLTYFFLACKLFYWRFSANQDNIIAVIHDSPSHIRLSLLPNVLLSFSTDLYIVTVPVTTDFQYVRSNGDYT